MVNPMKSLFRAALAVASLTLVSSLQAQTPPAPTGTAPAPIDCTACPASDSSHHAFLEKMAPYLSADQKAEFKKALFPALEKDPTLKDDGIALMQEGKAARDGSQEDKDAFHKKMAAYEARLRKAMTAEDPGVSAIFDAIEAHTPALHA
jgi:hypothetical protein